MIALGNFLSQHPACSVLLSNPISSPQAPTQCLLLSASILVQAQQFVASFRPSGATGSDGMNIDPNLLAAREYRADLKYFGW